MPKFLTPIDLNKLEIRNFLAHVLAAAPGSPVEGQVYYDSVDKALKFYNATVWSRISEAWLLARANHTGTQAASTISDLAAVVQAYRLDQFAAPNTDLSMGTHKITNVTDPSAASDAATKNYVDTFVNGLQWKESVRVATTANIVLSGTQTIDGVAVVATNRVLVKDQNTGSENGIWVVAAGAWSRATDADVNAEVRSGMACTVQEGTENDNTAWVLGTNNPINVGVTSLTFVQLSGGGVAYTADETSLHLTGTVFSVKSDWIVPVTQGGTNSGTAAGARSNLGATGKYTALIGNGALTTITINQATHGLAANASNLVQVTDASTGDVVYPDISVAPASGNVSITFASAPALNAYRVTIIG